jgi:LPS export ABC transporter protein LptC
VGFLFLSSCTEDNEGAEVFLDDKQYQFEQGTNVTILYSDSAQVELEVKAPLLKRFTGENPYSEMPNGFVATTFGPAGNTQSIIQADYGKRYDGDKSTFVEGNVVIVNINGDTLNTEKLSWYEMQDSLYTDAPVVIITPNHIIRGKGLISNSSFSKYRILQPTGVISIADPTDEEDE